MSKYLAFVSFGHNGVSVKLGEIFDAKEKKFKIRDIDFLLSQNKIMLVDNKNEISNVNISDNKELIDIENSKFDADKKGIIDLSVNKKAEETQEEIKTEKNTKTRGRRNKADKNVTE